MNEISDIKITEPHSTEAEQMLIGAVMANNELYHQVGSIVRPEHFYDPLHGAIWSNIAQRVMRDHLASPVTLSADFEGHDGLKEVGGPSYLVKMAGMGIQSATGDMALQVVELWQKRKVLEKIRSVEHDLCHGNDLAPSVAELELMLHEAQEESTDPRSMSLFKAMTLSVQHMDDLNQGREVGIPTGLKSLDEMVTLAPKRYSVLGGSTSMGKTALGIWIMYSAAKAGAGVGFVTLEMPEQDLAKRANAIASQVPYKAMDRKTSENTFRQVVEGVKTLQDLPVEIFSEKVRDVPSILSEGKRLKRKWKPQGEFQGLKLLVIDYIQLVRGKGESSFVRLSQVANDLKQVAKMLDVHVLALAQVDRKISASGEHSEARPKLAHLRGSGDLENAPDNVLFIHRPEYFLTRQTPPQKVEERADWEAELSAWKGKAEIIIEKARMGDIGSIKVGCDMATNRFWSLEDQGDMEF